MWGLSEDDREYWTAIVNEVKNSHPEQTNKGIAQNIVTVASKKRSSLLTAVETARKLWYIIKSPSSPELPRSPELLRSDSVEQTPVTPLLFTPTQLEMAEDNSLLRMSSPAQRDHVIKSTNTKADRIFRAAEDVKQSDIELEDLRKKTEEAKIKRLDRVEKLNKLISRLQSMAEDED